MTLYGYDASVYNSVQGSANWEEYFNHPETSGNIIGSINTAYTVGAIVGGFFFGGPIADYAGRKAGMFTGCVLVIIATFIQTFAPRGKIAAFLVGRCVVGVGQGVALTSGPTYIGELSPAYLRGQIMACWQMFYSVGAFICFWIAYATNKHKEKLGDWDWKIVVIFQLMIPALVCIILPFLPGTPRWYIKRGHQIDKAREALRKTRYSEQEVEEELQAIIEAVEYEKEAVSPGYSALWKDKSVRKRFLIAAVLNAGQQLTGQGSLNTYSSKVYQKVFTNSNTIMLINALNATLSIPFTLTASLCVDRFGRRFLFIVGGLGMAACLFSVATVETQTPDLAGGAKSHSVGIAIVFLLFFFAFFYKPSWGATVWVWSSEVFSMNIRAQAIGMASQTQNVVNAIVQQFFPTFLNNCGFYAFYFFAGLNVLLVIFVFFFVPETKKIPLEEIDVLFGGESHTQATHGDKEDPEKVAVEHDEKLAEQHIETRAVDTK
ncbi:hypothetical protein KEM52_006304 [Ascosphaera acerosa]|nr:hypothetical protein KEM52_006304 [Ascosphaera acerosa]